MQNSKCIMQNDGVPSARSMIISEGNTFILHTAFSILHSTEGHYDTLTDLRIWEIAPFSSRDTWAWEIPSRLATSIWVLPS